MTHPATIGTGDDGVYARRVRAWSDYWATKALHSCGTSFSGNYAGTIARFWDGIFDQLPPASQVLDLCCGNASLSKLLLESAASDRVHKVVAVDAARIAPPWLAEAPPAVAARLEVHAGVDAAALPFPDASFDLCISQFGIEYAGRAALAECQRVLRPSGRLAAIVHHIDSLPVRIAREECRHIDYLLEPEGLYARAQAIIEPMAHAATAAGRERLKQDPVASAARVNMNAALAGLKTRLESADYPDVLLEQRDAVMALIAHVPSIGADAGRKALSELREALLASRLRQQELIDHACTEADLRGWMAPLDGAIEHLAPQLFDNGELAGWALVASRNQQTR